MINTTIKCRVDGEIRTYCFKDTEKKHQQLPQEYSAGTDDVGGIIVTRDGAYITHLSGVAEVLHFLINIRAQPICVVAE